MSASVPSWAVPGAKVVCIDDGWWLSPSPGFADPRIGDVLTIRDLNFSRSRLKWGASFIEKHVDDIFGLDCFRPLVTRSLEHDVAQFRKLLIGAPKGVDA